jgi:predicted transcriptional regulator
MILDDVAVIKALVEKIDSKFINMTQKQQDLADKIDNQIKRTEELTEYHEVYQSLPLSMTCK